MTNTQGANRIIRGSLLHCLADPTMATVSDETIVYIEDGLLIIEQGHIAYAGDYAVEHIDKISRLTAWQQPTIEDYTGKLIVPGFIDCHVHYPQTEMIAAYGKRLLDWLNTYTFPVESQFGDIEKADQVAQVFLQQLLSNGTTTAAVFCSVHPESVDAFFQQAQQQNLRMIAGKVLMDRNAPANVLDTPVTGYQQSIKLIDKWHGKGRLHYAVTPRFAPTSSQEQLALAGQLLTEYPDLYMQTHLAESVEEIAWVEELFPDASHYLDVYDQAGLLGQRSLFGHGIHLCDQQIQRLAETGSKIIHCPTSNLFIGSGLLPLQRLQQADISLGMGTDVGGGSSFSMLQTLAEAYKVQQLNNYNLSPEQAFYYATLGGAKALELDTKIGNFTVGKEADFLVLDPKATPLLSFRSGYCRHWQDTLFMLQMLGDDRVIWQTNIMGQVV